MQGIKDNVNDLLLNLTYYLQEQIDFNNYCQN